MAREGISPAGQAGFETDITQAEVELLLRGFIDRLAEEQPRVLGHEQQTGLGHEQQKGLGHEQQKVLGHEQPLDRPGTSEEATG